jgi:hypothetical protein
MLIGQRFPGGYRTRYENGHYGGHLLIGGPAAHDGEERRVGHGQPLDLPTVTPNWRCTRAQKASLSHSRASW